MKKNGFTLVELLAVVIVLGLVMTIIISNLSKGISDSKKETYLNSAKSLVNSLNEYYVRLSINDDFNACSYNFNNDKNTCVDFSFNGKKPDSGTITIDENGNINGYLAFDEYEYQIVDNDVDIFSNFQYSDKIGEKYNFTYSSNESVFVVPYDGYYQLETWGAQGASYNETYIGGYGGYSTGMVYLIKNTKIFITVGKEGILTRNYGDGLHNVGTGGGATYIKLKSGNLSSFENDLSSILIVAGGGGSANYHTSGYYGSGGSAGGYIGNSGEAVGRTTRVAPTGGTQSQGGTGEVNGRFGLGGVNGDYSSGGDGFYGGGASNGGVGNYGLAGTGGGSGYIGNKLLTNKMMSCYKCQTSNKNDTLTISVNESLMEPTSGVPKKGSGYASITFLGQASLVYDFDYKNKEQSFKVPYDGKYKLEVWGAQGGNCDNTYIGGYGGYATGVISLSKGQKLYINVGGKGTGGNHERFAGGYNGGGNASSPDDYNYIGSGGGATHIALTSGLLKDVAVKNLLIVAGGGGGSYNHTLGGGYGNGGSGGGYMGNQGNGNNAIGATGGNQSSGGIGYCNGSYGLGANCTSGGGGGFYGGGATAGRTNLEPYNFSGAGGGSGYIGNNLLFDKFMYCFKCTSSADPNNLTYFTDNVSNIPISNFAKMENGFAKITYLGN